MVPSTTITAACIQQPNPAQAELDFWNSTRYLMTHEPVQPGETKTSSEYYRGHRVIPGPKANPALVAPFYTNDLNTLKNVHGIRFTDFNTTAGADMETVRANYGAMDDQEADQFEKLLSASAG